jgi:hypothetical protein
MSKAAKEELEKFKKPRPVFTKGSARAIVLCKGPPDLEWLQRDIEQLCRENCWPMSLIANDFLTKLGNLFEAKVALAILEGIRARYAASHPFQAVKDTDLETAAKELEAPATDL